MASRGGHLDIYQPHPKTPSAAFHVLLLSPTRIGSLKSSSEATWHSRGTSIEVERMSSPTVILSKERVLSRSERDGVIFQAIIGCISVISLLCLLAHVISVSFVPVCLSALNIRQNTNASSNLSSTGASNSADIGSNVMPSGDRKSSMPPLPRNDGESAIQLERARTLAERRARARADEILRQQTKHREERLFLRMQLGIFIVCMLVSDLIQSIAALIQARWAVTGRVSPGAACWIQAAAIMFGDVSTAVWNSVIACHTFAIVVLGARIPTFWICVVMVCGWTIPFLVNIIGLVVVARPGQDFFGVTAAAWCFVADEYRTERIVLHYVPLIVAALIITIMYGLVSLTMRGNLQVTPIYRGCVPWCSFTFRRTRVSHRASGNTDHKQVAYLRTLSLKMLWYPVVYICLILPITICRMVELRHTKAPQGLIFFAMTLLFLVGLSNVAIYVATRNVGLQRRRTDPSGTTSQNGPAALGTQVEVYIDRVTRHDGGVVTIGGSKVVGDTGPGFQLDDLEMGRKKYDGNSGDTSSSRDSFDQGMTDKAQSDSPPPALRYAQTSDKRGPSTNQTDSIITRPEHTMPRKIAGPVFIERVGRPHSPSIVAPFNDIISQPETGFNPSSSLGRGNSVNTASSSNRRSILVTSATSPLYPNQHYSQNTPTSDSDPFSRNPYRKTNGNV
ncbi:hypothetical protein FRC20_002003 [Serendipita sp. 405]|nr:hypothetical protein FRC20_002003 [Serendipita sp. 405]